MSGGGDGFAHFLELCLEFFHDSEVGCDRLSFEHVVIVVFHPDDADLARISGFKFICK